jgi:hypothetical protein
MIFPWSFPIGGQKYECLRVVRKVYRGNKPRKKDEKALAMFASFCINNHQNQNFASLSHL